LGGKGTLRWIEKEVSVSVKYLDGQGIIKHKMIEIWTESLPQDYWWLPNDYIGGTPEYVVNTARELKSLGHDVIVYYDNTPTELDGVFYLPRNQYQGNDIVLACNEKPPKLGKRNIYWTSKYGQTDEMFKEFDERIVLSKYHQSLFGKNSKVIPLACNSKDLKPEKKEFFALYSSSPDRGLDFLLKMWPEIYETTRLRLKTSYGASGGQTKVSGVDFLGKLPESEMNSLYRKAKFWLHPAQGIELFCISGRKAQTAGCIPVVIPNMALDETILFGVRTDDENFKKDLLETIKYPPFVPKMEFLGWCGVTMMLDNVIKNT